MEAKVDPVQLDFPLPHNIFIILMIIHSTAQGSWHSYKASIQSLQFTIHQA